MSPASFGRLLAGALAVLVAVAITPSARGDDGPSASTKANGQEQSTDRDKGVAAPAFTMQTLEGRLVWMAEALERLYGIETDPDAAEAQIALETKDGQIVPLAKDSLSRGFWLDPRLRTDRVELLVRRYERAPTVQLIRWYALRDGRKLEIDYWCDICAIPMYELKTCECCQGEIRLRERPVEEEAP